MIIFHENYYSEITEVESNIFYKNYTIILDIGCGSSSRKQRLFVA